MNTSNLARNPRAGIAVATTALAGALALPVWQSGVGWLLVALTTMAAIAASRTASRPSPTSTGERWWRGGAGCTALALVAVAALRDAAWLVVLCLAVATALGSFALAGGTTWRGLARGLAALPGAGVWALLPRNGPGGTTSRRWWRITIGLGSGVVLVVVFGLLFRSADPAFARLLEGWTQSLPRVVSGLALAGILALGAIRLARTPAAADTTPSASERNTRGLTEWLIPLVMLDALFAVFVTTQVPRLFAGKEYVLGRSGPDYADFARDGFAQLAVVTVLTLGVVIALSLVAGRTTARERALLRGFGGALCVLTLVIVASALTRLMLYVDAYGFNGPRLVGFAVELWLGLVFVLILIAGMSPRARWLPRTVAAAGVCVLLGMAVINPEAMMARTHMDRVEDGYPLDIAFLSQLSADAIDEIDTLPEPARSCALRRLSQQLEQPDPWYGLNVSRQHARQMLREGHILTCTTEFPS